MNREKLINYLRIFFVLMIAFFISKISVDNVFIADSPKVRPNLDQYLIAKVRKTSSDLLAKFTFNFSLPTLNTNAPNFVQREETIEFLKNNLEPVTKGVSAASKGNYSYTEYLIDEIEWVHITYTLKNGKTVKIRYPKGTSPPPKEIYENWKE